MHNRSLFILAMFMVVALAVSACAPQAVEPPVAVEYTRTPTSTFLPPTATAIPATATIAATVPESTPTAVPTIPETLPTIPVDMTPPPTASSQIRTLEVVTTTFTVEGAQGTQYSIADSGRLVGMAPNGDMILRGGNYSLLIVDTNNFTARPLFENVRLPIRVSPKDNRIIFPLNSLSKQYSIWSANINGGDPIFLGTTTGNFPFFSVTDDGKVLLNENNHLILKWLEGETVQSQPLDILETQLGLDWSGYDYVQTGPDEMPPWINFEISPDGRWVAIFDSEQVKLWLATLDGQQIIDVPLDPELLRDWGSESSPYVGFMGWSPDSSQIAYREGILTNLSDTNYYQIKIVDTVGNPPIQITSAETGWGGYLAWSFDGQHIAFSFATYKEISVELNAAQMGVEPQRGTNLYVANPDGSEAQKVSETHYPGGLDLFWHPNKHMLLYTCWNGDSFDVCTFDLDSK